MNQLLAEYDVMMSLYKTKFWKITLLRGYFISNQINDMTLLWEKWSYHEKNLIKKNSTQWHGGVIVMLLMGIATTPQRRHSTDRNDGTKRRHMVQTVRVWVLQQTGQDKRYIFHQQASSCYIQPPYNSSHNINLYFL